MVFAARTAGSVRVLPAWFAWCSLRERLCAGSARQASGSFSSCAAGVRVKGLASPLTIPASGSLHAALRAVPSLLTSALRTARIRRPGSCRALADVLSARPGRRARLSVSDASVTPSPVISHFYKRLCCLNAGFAHTAIRPLVKKQNLQRGLWGPSQPLSGGGISGRAAGMPRRGWHEPGMANPAGPSEILTKRRNPRSGRRSWPRARVQGRRLAALLGRPQRAK